MQGTNHAKKWLKSFCTEYASAKNVAMSKKDLNIEYLKINVQLITSPIWADEINPE